MYLFWSCTDSTHVRGRTHTSPHPPHKGMGAYKLLMALLLHTIRWPVFFNGGFSLHILKNGPTFPILKSYLFAVGYIHTCYPSTWLTHKVHLGQRVEGRSIFFYSTNSIISCSSSSSSSSSQKICGQRWLRYYNYFHMPSMTGLYCWHQSAMLSNTSSIRDATVALCFRTSFLLLMVYHRGRKDNYVSTWWLTVTGHQRTTYFICGYGVQCLVIML